MKLNDTHILVTVKPISGRWTKQQLHERLPRDCLAWVKVQPLSSGDASDGLWLQCVLPGGTRPSSATGRG